MARNASSSKKRTVRLDFNEEEEAAPRSSASNIRIEEKEDQGLRKRRRLPDQGEDQPVEARADPSGTTTASVSFETNASSSGNGVGFECSANNVSTGESIGSDGDKMESIEDCRSPPGAKQPCDGKQIHLAVAIPTRHALKEASEKQRIHPPRMQAHNGPTVAEKEHSVVVGAHCSCTPHSTPIGVKTRRRSLSVVVLLLVTAASLVIINALRTNPKHYYSAAHEHVILPNHVSARWSSDLTNLDPESLVANLTLRQVLADPSGYHLAMAPAFFGFYGYFGALAAWEELVGPDVLRAASLRSVAGASAGAMAAVLLAAGIRPRVAADFCATMTLDKFADFPGILAVFRGNKFERIMSEFLIRQAAADGADSVALQLQNASIPVAVSAFDLQSLSGKILRTGSMARAARASATFPFLFQPVGVALDNEELLCIDGGITDFSGLQGTKELLAMLRAPSSTSADSPRHRVINLSVGDFLGGSPPGPSTLSASSSEWTTELISVSLRHLPLCGPWAMSNGPRAVEAAFQAMRASLDVPLHLGTEENHYELHIDTSKFWEETN